MLGRALLVGLASLATLVAQVVTPAFAQTPDAGQSAVQELNRIRATAGLGPVSLDTGSAAPLHAHYLALNANTPATAGLNVHTEQPGLPGYTAVGAAVAGESNIDQGSTTAVEAVRSLVDVPLHRHWMLSPNLTHLGVGTEGGWWVLDLADALTPWNGAPRVVSYPPANARDVPYAFSGNEVPNPLTAVPGLSPTALVGYPITLHIYGCDATNAQASLSANGVPVASYFIAPGTVLQATGGHRTVPFVLLFPQAPLRPSTTYTATATASCGSLGAGTYTWSFTTGAAFNPTATQVQVDPAAADGTQAITLRAVNTDGGPVSGAHLTHYAYNWSYPAGAPGNQPVLQPGGASDDNGLLQFRFNLMGASSADLSLDLVADGITTTVPIHVTHVGSGHLSPLQVPANAASDVSQPAFKPVVPDLAQAPASDQPAVQQPDPSATDSSNQPADGTGDPTVDNSDPSAVVDGG